MIVGLTESMCVSVCINIYIYIYIYGVEAKYENFLKHFFNLISVIFEKTQ